MATSGNVQTNTEYDSYFFVNWNRTETWNNTSDCGSIIYWEAGVHCGHSFGSNAIRLDAIEINGQKVFEGSSYSNLGTGDHILASGTLNIAHNNNGTKSFLINGFSGWLYANHNYWADGSWYDLDSIPRYLNFTRHELRSKTINSISINWATDKARDWTQYKLNGGTWTNAYDTVAGDNKSGYYTISGLTPNTKYTIKTRCRRSDSGLWTESNTLTISTYDIAKISDLNDFEHGQDISLVITNPSGNALNLSIKIDDTKILDKTVVAGNNTISFTDEELDSIYRLYGSSNTVTATFVLTTANNYTDTKTITITLTGNQKTAYTTGIKRAKVFVCVDGKIKRAVVWIGNNGRKRCI